MRLSVIPTLLYLPAALFFGWSVARCWPHTADDGFVFLQYARNLTSGLGLVFNPGERVEGFSNALWVLLLAAGHEAGVPWLPLTKGLGAAFAAVTLIGAGVLAHVLTTELGARSKGAKLPLVRPADIAAAFLVSLLAVQAGFGYYTTSGMGTTVVSALTVWGVGGHLVEVSRGRPTRPWHCYVPLALLAMTRPEAVVLVALTTAHRLWWLHTAVGPDLGRRTTIRVELFGASLVALPWLLMVGARWIYYGEVLPNTFYAKPAPGNWHAGASYLWDFGTGWGLLLGPLLGSLLIVAIARPSSRRISGLCVLLCVPQLFFILYSGGDWMAHARFLQPILPLLLLLPILGLNGLAEPRKRPVALILLLLTVVYARHSLRFWSDLDANSYYDHALSSRNNVAMARWMAQHLDPGASILTDEIGAIGFYSGLRVLDQWGLVDHEIARILHENRFNPYNASPSDPKRRLIQHRIASTLLSRRPDYITVDYRAPVPGPQGYDPRWILPITMTELYQQLEIDYSYLRAFALMEDPPKTFLLFERRSGRREP